MGNRVKYPEPDEELFRYGERMKVRTGQTRYTPGEEVDLKLKFKVTKEKLPPMRVTVRITGTEDVYWHQSPTEAKAKGDSLTRTMFCCDTEQFLNEVYEVDNYAEGMNKGHHQYTYYVKLPSDLPGSFMYKYSGANCCTITYYLYVELISTKSESEVVVGRCVLPLVVGQDYQSIALSSIEPLSFEVFYHW